MLKQSKVSDLTVYKDILVVLDRRKLRHGADSTASAVIRKYVEFALEADFALTYSNYNTTLHNCCIGIYSDIKADNNRVKSTEINLLDDIERELKKPHQRIIEEEIDYVY